METITAEAMAPVNKKKGLGLPPKKIVNANGTQMPIANAPKKLLINQAPQIQAIHRMGSKNDAIKHQHQGRFHCPPIAAANLLVLLFVQCD